MFTVRSKACPDWARRDLRSRSGAVFTHLSTSAREKVRYLCTVQKKYLKIPS
jgi:hypothetical protein